MTAAHDHRRRALLKLGAGVALGGAAVAGLAAAKPRVIKVVAKKFVFVPDEIQVRRGESVVLEFSAPEVPMGCNLPDFKLRADIVPGKPVRMAFTPDRAGSYTFVCDVFCGSGHEDMSGTLVVS